MAEGVLFNIAEEIIKTLGSLTAQEVALWWGLKDQLRKLNDTVTSIKAVIQDAEEQAQTQNHQIEVWLKKLREAVYDAEDLLDDFSTQVLRKQLMPGKRVSREVRLFFSRSNQFVYGLRMGHRVKALRETLDDIETDSKRFNFVARQEEGHSLTTVREETTSSEPEVIVGRVGDKVVVKTFLMNSNCKHNVSVISVVGIGGLGKTTLAQNVYNDEQVQVHFGVKLWVSVSGSLDVRKIIKGAVGSDSDDQLESLKKKLEEKIERKKYLLVLDDVWDGEDDGEKWDRLKELLPRDAVGSKIVVTTRSHLIAKFTSTVSHVLQGLSVDESWDLFRSKAFPQGQESGHVDERIRKEIVERCCGVPLVIKAIARLMSLKDSDSDIDLYDKMLQSLRPNSSLQQLRVEGYGGMRFPSWVSHLSNLASIVLRDCGRLKHIPPLDGIPSLEDLIIWGLDDLECIDSEGVGGKGVPMFFPSLKRLVMWDCGKLKGWWKRRSRDEMNDDSDKSTIEEGLIMLSFPRLSSLSIEKCPNLTSMPLFPTLDEDLRLRSTSSMPLQQTMKMTSPVSSSSFIRPLSKLKRLNIGSIDDMESLPKVGLQNLSSLQKLWICGCPRLKSLPLPDQGMHSLQILEVDGCRELKSLSESESQGMIPYLPSLQALSISYCSEELSGRARGWGKESEEEWPNIKHIPDIVIDGYYIQKEGRYVKGEGLRRY